MTSLVLAFLTASAGSGGPVAADGAITRPAYGFHPYTTEWQEPNGGTGIPWLSEDARYVAFLSGATNLILGDTNYREDIFRMDRATNRIERVSISSTGAQSSRCSSYPSMS